MNTAILGIDLAKHVFQLHGIDPHGRTTIQKKLTRAQLAPVIEALPPCIVAMEACSSSHHWGRKFQGFGHTVKLIPPQYVKPFVKTNKNDSADAEAIAEAAGRPSMRTVEVKSLLQQDIQVLHRSRERIVSAKTSLLNSIRGLCSEYGMIAPKGCSWLGRDLPRTRVQLESIGSAMLMSVFERTLAEFSRLEEEQRFYDLQLKRIAEAHPVAQRLMKIPGVGVLCATAMLSAVHDPGSFKNGRHFAAFLGLVPRQHSSGGKQKLLGISKRGNQYLRRILVSGAQSILRLSSRRTDRLALWVTQLRKRKTWNVTAVALANKNARIIWHLLRYDVEYQG